MNKVIFFLAILFSLNSCKGQEENKQNNNKKSIKSNTMEHFDIEKYKDWEVDPEYRTSPNYDKHYQKDYKKVRITYVEEEILLEESDNTPYITFKSFSLKTKSLTLIGRTFYDANIGIWKYYDENGNLIKETNEEPLYKLSVEDIIKIMKQEYNMDLMDTSLGYSLSRDDYEFPQYEIIVRLGDGLFRIIIINADNGKTVSDSQYSVDDKFKKKKEKKVGLGTPYKNLFDLPPQTHKIYEGIAYTQDEWKEFVSKQSWYWRLMHT